MDCSPVKRDQALRDGKTKARASIARRAGYVNAEKPLKDAFVISLGDPDTGVADKKPALFRCNPSLNPHASARLGIPHCVIYEDHQNSLDHTLIPLQRDDLIMRH